MFRPLLLAFIFAFFASVKAQNAPVINAASDPARTSTSEVKQAESKNAATVDAKLVGKPKKTEKPEKPAVNVSPRFRSTLPPEKLAPMRIPRFEVAPAIDGKLDDEVWKQAAQFKDFFQTSPGDNIEPSKPTVALIGYDAENLYIAFHCFDEPDKIRATIAKRDEILNEDNVRVHLDTFNDQRRAFVVGFNPLGVQQDGLFTEGSGTDYSFDIVMESKGVIVSDGWTLEARIPFKSLRYQAGKGKLWGIHIWRNIDRFNDEIDSWMPQDRNVTGFLNQEGKITGLENIKVERTLELVPSVTLRQIGERIEDSAVPTGQRFLQRGVGRDFGLTTKFVITPNITLDAAINPDFAEVEADAPVVTANQRFPLFFPELRPFFLEGIDIFNSPLNVVYTRTIQNPDVATKLTGKIGKNVFGILAAQDNVLGTDDNAQVAVARVRRDVGRQNYLGFFGTGRIFQVRDDPQNSRRNFVGGADGRFVLSSKLTSQFQVVGSHSRRKFYDPEVDRSVYRTGNGVAYYWNLDYTTRDRGWFLEGSGASRDYRSDVGFIGRTNTNRVFFATRLSTAPKPKNKIIRVNWETFGETKFNWQGRSQEGFVGTGVNVSLQRNTNIGAEGGAAYERLFEEEFGARRTAENPNQGAFFGAPERSSYQSFSGIFFNTQPTQKITVRANVNLSLNSFDFDFGAGNRFPRVSPAFADYTACVNNNSSAENCQEAKLDPGTGTSLNYTVFAELRPTNPFRVSLNYRRSRLVRADTGRTAFDSNIFTLRSTYQFTKFTFLRARWDYFTDSGNVNGQLLLGYNPNPGTAFYIGYNDNFNYNGFNPFTSLGEPRFERNSRTFFIRATYLIRRSF